MVEIGGIEPPSVPLLIGLVEAIVH